MAAVKGREQRKGVSDAQFLGVRLTPPHFAKVDEIAQATRLSKAKIVELLVERLKLDDDGWPVEWADLRPVHEQEALPLKSA
jgi:hypothetical protein